MDHLVSNSPQNYITIILNNTIRIENVSEAGGLIIKELNGHEDELAGERVWILDFKDEKQEADLLSKLNEAKFLFVGQPAGWPPAEIFDDLREKGLVTGMFMEVTWIGPGKWVTRLR